ncbi:MAG: caspase family protein [Caldilineaceae bacterium]|nr:caspase family protein [Caldilineaceae bacterium]
MASTPRLYALLVGVDRYKSASVPNLRGCVADVRAMHTFLTTRLRIPEESIQLLISDGGESPQLRATRQNILDAWQRLIDQIGEGDQLFFHYSGHGAQARSIDPNEADGYDETLVPYDSRDVDESGAPVYDIIDKELAALIDKAEGKGAVVTIFLDCCHSGSGTREAEKPDLSKPLTRRGPLDLRVRPTETLIDGVRLTGVVDIPDAARNPSGWQIRQDSQHVLLAGCRDEELSHEYRSPETGDWHGATTYFLIKSLQNYHPDLTWSEVYDFVQARVNAIYARQRPQLEGPANRQVFGGVLAPETPYLLVRDVEEDGGQVYVQIDGGAAVGLSEGSQIALYPPGSQDLSGDPLATGSVIRTALDHVWAQLETAIARADVPIGARVRITAKGFESLVYNVAVEDSLARQALQSEGGASPFLAIVGGDEPGARFRVAIRNDQYVIHDGSGAQIVTQGQPLNEAGAAQIAANLHHLAVYNNVRNLRNPSPPPDLQSGIVVEASSFTSAGFAGPRDGIPLEDTGMVLTPGRKIWFTAHNKTSETLYLTVFNLNANYGIRRVSPARASHHTVAAGQKVDIPSISPRVNNPFASRSREILKVFVTRAPLSFDVLEMEMLNEPPLPVGEVRDAGPLGELLKGIRRQGTRELVVDENAHDGWITKQVEITVLAENQAIPLGEGERSVELGSPLEMTLTKPADFGGDLIFSSVAQLARSVDIAAPIPLPPGLSQPDAQAIFQPLTFAGSTRSVGGSPGVIALNSTPQQIEAVSEQNPLQLELTVEDEPDLAGILPVAYDGEFFFLAGGAAEAQTRSLTRDDERRLAVTITHLPLPADADAESGSRTAGDLPTRDLKRTVRLFLYKVYKGRLPEDTGVRRVVRAADGRPVYGPITAADVAQAQKVALLVHGFTSDTGWFAQKVIPHLDALGNYDLYLTYDYETFNTSVLENGAILAQALTALGFGAADGIHLDIFCHSMGSQVARALVELKEGHRYVDRVFMGGAPNAGTRLAELKKLIFWLGTVALNHAGPTPPALIANWFLKKAVDSGVSINDLMPNSELYRALNDAVEALGVPYFVQIGTNARFDRALKLKTLFSRTGLLKLADMGLDQLLGGPNDIAVSVASAGAVRRGHWQPLVVETVPGDHFEYFQDGESVDLLGTWLAGDPV